MRVNIPSPLLSYTHQQKLVEAEGDTVAAVLDSLNRTYPGIKFRMIDEHENIRKHIRIFVDKRPAEKLDVVVAPTSEVQIICALSGG